MPVDDKPSRNILVVEDDAASRSTLVQALEAEGYAVTAVANGQEALDHLRQHQTTDLILLNLMMPVMNGWQFRSQQTQDPALADIPVIVLSSISETARQVNGLGDVGYLEKPIRTDQLLAAVQRFTFRQPPTVLVVEDHDGVRKMLDIALRHHGFNVKLAANGREAIALYQNDGENIALVLLDVQMPELDGPQTLAVLRQFNPQLLCCFMSGNTGRYGPRELLEAGAAHIFQKPFGVRELSAVLWRLARKSALSKSTFNPE
jgi:CheY-like chemotaxis protein